MSILSQTTISDFAKGLLDRAGIAPEGVNLGSILQELQKVLGSAANLTGEPVDGDRHVTTSNLTVSGLFTSGRLDRDAYFDTLKVDGSGRVNGKQFILRAKTLDLRGAAAGTLHCNGNVAVVDAGGAAYFGGRHGNAGAGGDGGTGTTTNGNQAGAVSALALANGGAGGAGGAGGTGSGGTAGASRSGGAITARWYINAPEVNNRIGFDGAPPAPTVVAGGNGGAGGSGGSGSGAAAGGTGGGGGGGAGVLLIVADELVVNSATAAGAISAIGGAGAVGSDSPGANRGAGGGGGGGGGGEIVLIVGKVTGSCPNLLSASGGAGGAGGAGAGALAGANGVGGTGGRISVFNLSTGETTIVAGSAGSGVTGGACVASV